VDRHVKIIADFRNLKSRVQDSRNIVGFDTKNGKRLILRFPDEGRCLPVDRHLRLVKLEGEPFEKTPFDLLLGYFIGGDVAIDRIVIFPDKTKALRWLFSEKSE